MEKIEFEVGHKYWSYSGHGFGLVISKEKALFFPPGGPRIVREIHDDAQLIVSDRQVGSRVLYAMHSVMIYINWKAVSENDSTECPVCGGLDCDHEQVENVDDEEEEEEDISIEDQQEAVCNSCDVEYDTECMRLLPHENDVLAWVCHYCTGDAEKDPSSIDVTTENQNENKIFRGKIILVCMDCGEIFSKENTKHHETDPNLVERGVLNRRCYNAYLTEK